MKKLKDSAEFQRVYKKGMKIFTRDFVLFFLRAKGEDGGLGITVTRGVGNACQRNRIKRQVKEFFRLNGKDLPKGLLVVQARMGAARSRNAVLRDGIAECVRKLNERIFS